MSWGPYEVMAVLNGLAMIGLGVAPGTGLDPKERLAGIGGGLLIGGYGVFVATRTTGAWYFPVQVLALPVVLLVYGVTTVVRHRHDTSSRPSAPPSTPRELDPAPLPDLALLAVPSAVPASAMTTPRRAS